MSREIDKEIIRELYSRTNDEKFTKGIFDRVETESEKKELLEYFRANEKTTLNQINHKALAIVADRWGIVVPEE